MATTKEHHGLLSDHDPERCRGGHASQYDHDHDDAGTDEPENDWQCKCQNGMVRCDRRVPRRGTLCHDCHFRHIDGYHAVDLSRTVVFPKGK